MNALFLAVVNMSLTGGIVIVAVMIVRLCLRRAPKIFSYLLWGVVLLRLLCPVSFSSVISVFQVVHVPVTEQGSMLYMPQKTVQAEMPDELYSVQPSISPSVNHPVKAIDQKETVRLSWDFGMGCSIVWITGVVVLWMYSAVSMFRLKRKLIGAVLDEKNPTKNIYLCDYIGTAFVMGVLRPRIYLPTTLTEAERRYILLHEKTHIKRGDHILRLLAFLALSIHWFNPLVWCAFSLSERDMEMSCDEAVMRKMGTDLRAAYSASLLNLASEKKVFASAPLGFGEGNVKRRIQNIMQYKKTAALIAVPILALVIIVSVALGSNPTNKNSEENDINKQQTESNSDNVEIIPVIPAVVPEETIIGADGPQLDYADENMFIFHDYFGLFVYDINQGELVSAVDLEPIGCQYTQGDAYCEVVVAKNGQKVYLHPMNIEEMYVYDVSEERLTRENYDLHGVELFDDLKSTEPDPTAWRSINCVLLDSDRCLYLENALGMVKELCYIVEQDHKQVRFARIFDDSAEEAGPFGCLNYTGYLDSCKEWNGYKQFTYQDYDGDGSVDRVYQKSLVPDKWCLYEIQFGNGDVIETGLFGIGIPEMKTCDLNGDGIMEILLQVSYGFSTDPNSYGEIAIFEKKNGVYEPLMPPEELCTHMEESDNYHPSITIVCKNGKDEFPEWASMPADVYQEVNTPHIHVAVKELTGENAIDEMVFLDSDLMMDFANIDTEQKHQSVSYKAEIVNNGKNDLIEFHFEALNKWSMDEVVVTAVYENGALHVAGARYEREGNTGFSVG